MRVRLIGFGGGIPFDPGRGRARRNGLLRSNFRGVLLLSGDVAETVEQSSQGSKRRRIRVELDQGDRRRRRNQRRTTEVRMFGSYPRRRIEADAFRFHGATNLNRTVRLNFCDR
jgi:hypothetical protein